MSKWKVAALMVAGLSIAACAQGSQAPIPQYSLTTGYKASHLIVTVNYLPSQADIEAILADLQKKYADKTDGYFVQINCATGGTSHVDNRLANGKFAVGPLGAARTGLSDGGGEIELVPDRQCSA